MYVVKDEDCYNVTQVRCGSCLRTTVVATPALSPAMDRWQVVLKKFHPKVRNHGEGPY